LKFKGRIVRDEWIKQAKTLAKGGVTEFSKRSKK
ncbi:MAG: NADH:quinone oxidoreductase, partial [Octadecabacter sp.]